MKFLLLSILFLCFSTFSYSQNEKEKIIFFSSSKTKENLVKQEFPNVPQEVRNVHARGQFRYLVIVDKSGKIEEVKPISGFSKTVDSYLIPTIKNWSFKPIEINGKKISFKTVIPIPFCYGSFSTWCFY